MPECIGPRCSSRAVHEHHVVYRQHWLRDGGELDDPRNLVPMCFRCHERHHSGIARLPLWVLPDAVFVALPEVLGAGRAYEYLGRRYSGRDLRHDALLLDAAA